MANDHSERLMREAAEIFFDLRDNPDDQLLMAKRDAFMARGQKERETYDHLLKTWKASGVVRAPKRLRSIVIFCLGLIGATALVYDPIRIAVMADVSTGTVPEKSLLSSSDFAYLAADTALQDHTKGESRAVTLVEGAAYFEVESDGRPVSVDVGEITVTVVGTEFETAFIDDVVSVSVTEGRVNVRVDDQAWELEEGDQFTWSENLGASVTERYVSTMSSWRSDRLSVDGLTFGQAADIIERRLSGPVIFSKDALRKTPVAGNVDLSEPLSALRLLADLSGAKVYHVPGLGRVITQK